MKNKVEFVQSHSFTRGAEHNRCELCAGGYDKWTYQYAKVVSGPLEGAVICPECLKTHDFAERAEKAAEEYEAMAEKCRTNAEVLRTPAEWDAPSFEEWREREDEADAAYVKERTAP